MSYHYAFVELTSIGHLPVPGLSQVPGVTCTGQVFVFTDWPFLALLSR